MTAKRLYRNVDDGIVGGVATGLAEHLNIDPVLLRIAFVIALFVSFGLALLAYAILWVVVPVKPAAAPAAEASAQTPPG